MTKNDMYIGVVLVLIITIISFFAWRYWKKHHSEHFSISTPATPRVREATGDLFVSLKHMVSAGRSFEENAKHSSYPELAGAIQSVSQMTKVLDRAETQLSSSPPTYVNYLAIYRGLSNADRTLLSASDAYVNAGLDMQKKIGSPGYVAMSNDLIAVGVQLRRVVVAVHRLGVALDVE